MTLVELLPAEIFAYFFVFTRIGAALMLMPGFGETFVLARYRLMLAVAITLVLTPVMGATLPAPPESPLRLFVLLAGEITIGAFLGLANAMTFDPVAAAQSAVTALFLSTAGLVVVFATDLHHVMLRALADSYNVLGPGMPPPIGDFSAVMARLVSDIFILGAQLAAPFIAVGLIFYLGVGLLARLMPQIQIFFVALPVQIFLGFSVMALTVIVILDWFTQRFPEIYAQALGG